MNKVNRAVDQIILWGLIVITMSIIGSCCRMDYRFQKQKFPNLTVGGYVWNRLIH